MFFFLHVDVYHSDRQKIDQHFLNGCTKGDLEKVCTLVRLCYGRNLDGLGLRGNGISENAEHGLATCISVASIKIC